nr:MAG TPA: hypothetical protein [Bacteriophage sp.]
MFYIIQLLEYFQYMVLAFSAIPTERSNHG